MTNILQQILEGPALETSTFPESSRYHGLGTLQIPTAEGTPIVYLKRRFLPPPGGFTILSIHRVREGERLDNITAQYIGDALQFWRVCDANGVMKPEELTAAIGNEIRITLPDGVQGASNA